MKLISFTTCSV